MARHFLTGEELTSAELTSLLDRAAELKTDRLGSRALERRSVALVFESPPRARVCPSRLVWPSSGGHPLVLREGELQLSRGESVRDTALVLSRFVHAICVRTGAHAVLEELAEHGSVPVINMLTRDHHPCQALADLFTLQERFGKLDGLKLAYVGDGNNVAHSLMVLGAKAGVHVAVATPAELARTRWSRKWPEARRRGRSVTLTTDPAAAAEGARRFTRTSGSAWATTRPTGDASCSPRSGSMRRCSASHAMTRGAALPARASRRGDLGRGALRAAIGSVGPGGEPASRAEGANGDADRLCSWRITSVPATTRRLHMKRWLALLIACLALGLVAVGCGDDDDDDSGGGSSHETTEQPATETEATGGGAAGPRSRSA